MRLIEKMKLEFRILNLTCMGLFSNRIGDKAENALGFQIYAEADRIL